VLVTTLPLVLKRGKLKSFIKVWILILHVSEYKIRKFILELMFITKMNAVKKVSLRDKSALDYHVVDRGSEKDLESLMDLFLKNYSFHIQGSEVAVTYHRRPNKINITPRFETQILRVISTPNSTGIITYTSPEKINVDINLLDSKKIIHYYLSYNPK
jgi:hypothetical protein